MPLLSTAVYVLVILLINTGSHRVSIVSLNKIGSTALSQLSRNSGPLNALRTPQLSVIDAGQTATGPNLSSTVIFPQQELPLTESLTRTLNT